MSETIGYRIKSGIGTAVSVALLVGGGESETEQEEVFLPGALLPANLAPRIAQAVDDGEEHFCSLIEPVTSEKAEKPAAKSKPAAKAAKTAPAPVVEKTPEDEEAGAVEDPKDGDNPFSK